MPIEDTTSEWQHRSDLTTSEAFKQKVLMQAIRVCHEFMNTETTDGNIKIKAKAIEILNQPDTFKDKLALSVAAIIDIDYFTTPDTHKAGLLHIRNAVTDSLDALAGQGL